MKREFIKSQELDDVLEGLKNDFTKVLTDFINRDDLNNELKINLIFNALAIVTAAFFKTMSSETDMTMPELKLTFIQQIETRLQILK